ncbi:hypothetical protein EVAR_10977_1 [Eumeta japonica]|uniref:Uncharacterized protein n=1 Tax=Eumeta variegata TaxID=151549 RepID=A0A4C1U690_EUMVA|nr:hypothetical protein EVAR_10977_1 [Eumeta japonica]
MHSTRGFAHTDIEYACKSFIWKYLAVNLNLISAFNSGSGIVLDFGLRHAVDPNPDPTRGLGPVLNFGPILALNSAPRPAFNSFTGHGSNMYKPEQIKIKHSL